MTISTSLRYNLRVSTHPTPEKALKAWRSQQRLSLKKAGAAVGVSAPTWLDWERGKKRPGKGPRRDLVEAVTGIPADAWATPADRALDARLKAAQADPSPPRPTSRTPRTKKGPSQAAKPSRRKPARSRSAKSPGPKKARAERVEQPQVEQPQAETKAA